MDFERCNEVFRYCDLRYFEALRDLRAYVQDPSKYNQQRRIVEAWAEAASFMRECLTKSELPEVEEITGAASYFERPQ
jgi:hypothetical protein